MTASVTESQADSQRRIYFLIVPPSTNMLDIFHILKKRGITSLEHEDYMTLCNALWISPWLPSVGSMCYVIYFSRV